MRGTRLLYTAEGSRQRVSDEARCSGGVDVGVGPPCMDGGGQRHDMQRWRREARAAASMCRRAEGSMRRGRGAARCTSIGWIWALGRRGRRRQRCGDDGGGGRGGLHVQQGGGQLASDGVRRCDEVEPVAALVWVRWGWVDRR